MDSSLRKIICRTCLTEASTYKSLLSKMDGDNRTLREILSNITNMDISDNDKYPKQVCDECHVTILKADEFRKRCVQSDMILKNGFLSHTFEEFIKHEINGSDYTNVPSSQLQNQIMNTSYLNSCMKNNELQTTEIELQLVDNFYDSTDCLRSELSYVKEEEDDFLQDDINDLTESNISENSPIVEYSQKLDISNNKPSVCGSAIDVALANHTNKTEKLIPKTDFNLNDNNENLVCTMCNEEFTNLDLFELHILKHKDDKSGILIQSYQCTLCSAYLPCEASLTNHMKTHKAKTKFKHKKGLKNLELNKNGLILTLLCPICTKKLPNYELFRQHLKSHKIENNINVKFESKEQFQCSICMRKFVHKSSLAAHIKKHEDSAQIKFTCKTCKREFQHKAHLENHVVLVHSKDKGYTCNICSRGFSTQESLDSHKEGHKVDKKHDCKICSKSFTMLSTLTEHIKIHTGEKPYLCSVCGRGFSQKNNMTQHMMRHQGVKPFKCDACERRFVSKGELEAHKRKHSGAHPFVCDDCGGSFTTSSSLTKHRRIHTGERPYACDLCTLRFTVLNTLKNHRRTHTGEKPYQCSYCEKAFTQRSDLVAHIRCHTGERPYICTSCGQAFRKASALKVHIKVHGKEHMIM